MTRLLSVFVLAAALGQSTDKPRVPYEDWGICPLEYCAYGRWTAQATMSAHATRSLKSPVVFTVRPHRKVTALTGLLATTTAGIVRFPRDVELGTLKVRAGEDAYLLTYEGEGMYRVWFKGQSYTHAGPICDETLGRVRECVGSILKMPTHEWWARIRNAKGQVGWVDMSYEHPAENFSFDAIPDR